MRYFWVNYYGEPNDFQKREKTLELADELSPEVALQLKRADDLAEYNHSIDKRIQEKATRIIKRSGFAKKYQAAIKKSQGDIPNELAFARMQIEETEKHLRQKRLHDATRTRTLTINEMLTELDNIYKEGYKHRDKLGEELYEKLCHQNIDFDDVIQILSDVILTEDDSKCISLAWRLSKRITEKDVTSDTLTGEEVRALFPELFEDTAVNKTSSKIIARNYNSYIERLMRQRIESHTKKVDALNAMKTDYKGTEL